MNIEKLVVLPLSKLTPFEKNARKHGKKDIDNIAKSIEKYGMIDPIGVWGEKNIIVEGHGRALACKQLGMTEVPCIRLDHLSDSERREYAIAHNATAELSSWDFDILQNEMQEIDLSDFDFELSALPIEFGEENPVNYEQMKKEFQERMASGELSEDDEEYQNFLAKFEAKKTTDDCYTPPLVYDAVADYVEKKYGVSKNNFVRPFVPNGDYQAEKYKKSDIVVDNPPFSILSEIVRWYHEHGVRFFLFAPALTLFNSTVGMCSFLCCGVPVTYENGAVVSTSFVTNLEKCAFRSAPKLYSAVKKANDETQKECKKTLRKNEYPKSVITSPMLTKFSKHGINFEVGKEGCHFIRALDAQKECGAGLYGSGFLISNEKAAEREAAEREAAEREAADVWKLSEREKEIINSLK